MANTGALHMIQNAQKRGQTNGTSPRCRLYESNGGHTGELLICAHDNTHASFVETAKMTKCSIPPKLCTKPRNMTSQVNFLYQRRLYVTDYTEIKTHEVKPTGCNNQIQYSRYLPR